MSASFSWRSSATTEKQQRGAAPRSWQPLEKQIRLKKHRKLARLIHRGSGTETDSCDDMKTAIPSGPETIDETISNCFVCFCRSRLFERRRGKIREKCRRRTRESRLPGKLCGLSQQRSIQRRTYRPGHQRVFERIVGSPRAEHQLSPRLQT
jgi:hypothetical protein